MCRVRAKVEGMKSRSAFTKEVLPSSTPGIPACHTRNHMLGLSVQSCGLL